MDDFFAALIGGYIGGRIAQREEPEQESFFGTTLAFVFFLGCVAVTALLGFIVT